MYWFWFYFCWTTAYLALSYSITVQEQERHAAELAVQAQEAQVRALRYQINPHFLFNTLNSISTLVLLKQTEPANAMLTRLSGFLRHTLVTQPGGKVSVAQEVETLKLYLDIERMRFEERLRTVFKIEPAAAKASVPSLLLQPLIENAIKYAVTASESGADIWITAHREGEAVRIEVERYSPQIPRPRMIPHFEGLTPQAAVDGDAGFRQAINGAAHRVGREEQERAPRAR